MKKTEVSTTTPSNKKQPTANEMREWFEKNKKHIENFAAADSAAKNLRDVTKTSTKVVSAFNAEYGKVDIEYSEHPLFVGINKKSNIWMNHHDIVDGVGKGFEVIASTKNTKIAAFANDEKKLYGVQFHPEFKSRPNKPHPLFMGFVEASIANADRE